MRPALIFSFFLLIAVCAAHNEAYEAGGLTYQVDKVFKVI